MSCIKVSNEVPEELNESPLLSLRLFKIKLKILFTLSLALCSTLCYFQFHRGQSQCISIHWGTSLQNVSFSPYSLPTLPARPVSSPSIATTPVLAPQLPQQSSGLNGMINTVDGIGSGRPSAEYPEVSSEIWNPSSSLNWNSPLVGSGRSGPALAAPIHVFSLPFWRSHSSATSVFRLWSRSVSLVVLSGHRNSKTYDLQRQVAVTIDLAQNGYAWRRSYLSCVWQSQCMSALGKTCHMHLLLDTQQLFYLQS